MATLKYFAFELILAWYNCLLIHVLMTWMLLILLHSNCNIIEILTNTYRIVVLISHNIASAYRVILYNTRARCYLNPDNNFSPAQLLRQGIHRDQCAHGSVVSERPSAGRPNRLLSVHACLDNGKSGSLVQRTMDSLKTCQNRPNSYKCVDFLPRSISHFV